MARELVFAVQPSDVRKGKVMDPAPVVEVRDSASGLVLPVTGADATISIAEGPAGAILEGVTKRPIVDGRAEFPGLVLPKESDGYRLQAEVNDAELVFPGGAIDDDTVARWRFLESSGAVIARDDGPNIVQVESQGDSGAIVSSPIGPACRMSGPEIYKVVESEFNRIADLIGDDFTHGILYRAYEITDQDIDLYSSDPLNTSGIYARSNTGSSTALAAAPGNGTTLRGYPISHSTSVWHRLIGVAKRLDSVTLKVSMYLDGVSVDVPLDTISHAVFDSDRFRGCYFRIGALRTGVSAHVDIAEVFFSRKAFTLADALADAKRCGVA